MKSRQIRRLLKKKGRLNLHPRDYIRHVLVCRRKGRVFATRDDAEKELARLIREEGYDSRTIAFPCKHCRQYHIGRLRKDQ